MLFCREEIFSSRSWTIFSRRFLSDFRLATAAVDVDVDVDVDVNPREEEAIDLGEIVETLVDFRELFDTEFCFEATALADIVFNVFAFDNVVDIDS